MYVNQQNKIFPRQTDRDWELYDFSPYNFKKLEDLQSFSIWKAVTVLATGGLLEN